MRNHSGAIYESGHTVGIGLLVFSEMDYFIWISLDLNIFLGMLSYAIIFITLYYLGLFILSLETNLGS